MGWKNQKSLYKSVDFEITKREVLVSICIIVLFLLCGMFFTNKISDSILDRNEKYNKAVKIEGTDLFQYGMDTNVGNAFVYGTLETIDPVTFPEIDGEYMYINKVKEKYTKHTRVVTYTDSNGKTKTKTKIYWSWDVIGSESKSCKQVKFSDIVFDSNKIDRPESKYIETINESYYIRYKYYGTPTTFKGTIFTDLRDGTITDGTDFYNNKTIEETYKMLVSNSSVCIGVFWVLWIPLMALVVFGFYMLENRWLE